MRCQPSPLGLLALVSLVVACVQPPEASVASSPSTSLVGSEDSGGSGVDPALSGEGDSSRVPISSASILPVLRPVGPEASLPRQVVIQFAREVVEAAAVGQSTEGTVVTVTPSLPGTLEFTGQSTLVFVPARPFTPETVYRVQLESLGSRDGVIEPPHSAAWLTEFRTPSFEARGLGQSAVDLSAGEASFQLRFSGPVSVAELRKQVGMRLDGRRPSKVHWEAGSDPEVVAFRVEDGRLKHGSELSLELEPGLHLRGEGSRAPGFKDAVEVRGRDLVSVVQVRRNEGPAGFFVEVICDDSAGGSQRRWWWDEATSDWFQISRRCIPDVESARQAVRVEPPLPFEIAPSQHGFRVLADFVRGSYTVSIDEGLTTEDGGVLRAPVSEGITVPARSPRVSFVGNGRYLPRDAWTSLGVTHLNVTDLGVSVRHIPQRNLAFWLSGREDQVGERISDAILDTRVAVSGGPDEEATSWLNLADLVPDAGKGVYEVTVSSGGQADAARLLVTDLNLVVKQGGEVGSEPGALSVWALGMHDNAPVEGVRMDLIRPSGKVLASCRTSRAGGCVLEPELDPADETPAFAIVASGNGDLTYLRFSDLRTGLGDAEVHGDPYSAEQPYRLAPWSDRGVYRPGDTAHLVALVRGEDDRAPEAGLPVELSVTDPRGNRLFRTTLETNAAGLLSHDVDFADFAATGRWVARYSIGSEEVAEYGFHVEEFVPERLRVGSSPVESELLAGQPIGVDIDARYLFGGSAEGSSVELACELQPRPFTGAGPTRGFTYGPWYGDQEAPAAVSLGAAEGELDSEGRLRLSCPGLDGGVGFQGDGRVLARTAVFEAASGRATRSSTFVRVHSEAFHLGLESGETEVEAGQSFSVSGVVVDWEGEPLRAVETVDLQFFRLVEEWGLMLDRRTGRERWRRSLRRVADGNTRAEVDEAGRFVISVRPEADSAGYLVRASAGQAVTELKLDGQGQRYWWYSEGSVDTTPRPLRPGSLELQLPDAIDVGEAARLSFVAPHAGRALVTVETAGVLQHSWMDVEPGPVEWSFSVQEFVPNVYVSALLLKDPHAESAEAFLPGRSFAVQSVTIRPSHATAELELDLPEEIRPNSTLTVQIEAPGQGEETWVSVAAVDAGILSLTGFEDPDPLAAIFSRRALDVDTYETVGWTLLRPPQGTSSSIGGDASASLGRVQMVKPVALWSGLVELDGDGRASVDLEVPQYRGALRVMAVSAGPLRVATKSAEVLVRDPLVLQATTPRFLVSGDRFEVPVFLTNTTDADRKVVVRVHAEALDVGGRVPAGPVSSPVRIEASEKELALAAGKGGVVLFSGETLGSLGAVRIRIEARSGALHSWDELDVPLQPVDARERRTHRVELSQGVTDLAPLLAGWVPTTEQSSIRVTSNPFGDVFDHLGFLVRYPYGCIEQTTSSTRPLLYVGRLVKQIDPELLAEGGVEERVEHGLRRILSMQTSSGGLGYWPGARKPHAWGTAYGVHLLLEASEAGYDVPSESLESALSWLERAVGAGETSRGAEPYMLYVLARAGRARTARTQELLAQFDGVRRGGSQLEQITLLRAALWLAGDRRYQAELLSPDLSRVSAERGSSESFYSDRRRRALTLNVLVDLFGPDPEGAPLAALVASALREAPSSYYTTQELAWSISGVGRWIREGADEFEPPVLRLDGKARTAVSVEDGGSERAWQVVRASEYSSVELELPSKGEGALYLLVTSEGVPEIPTPTGSEGVLRLSRTWQRADGSPLSVGGSSGVEPELGDLVYSVLHVTNGSSERVSHVALVDRFAAGLEVENPRLGGATRPEWLSTGTEWEVEHMNVRDDRVEVFGSLGPGETVSFAYALRAVTAGSFTAPSAEVEAMYDPRLRALSPSASVEVRGPWGDLLVAGD